MTVFFFVLSGGSGTRLWPLSRRHRPKQFLRLGCGKNLLEKTLDRLAPLLKDGRRLGVVAPVCFEPYMEQFAGRGIDLFVREPQARGTASAMLLAALRLAQYQPGTDPVVVFVPSDHAIDNEEAFRESLLAATAYAAQSDGMVLIGVPPTRPESGYGYLMTESGNAPFQVAKIVKFCEKPTTEAAAAMIAAGNVWWSTGIYVVRLSVLLRLTQEVAPQIWDPVQGFVGGARPYTEVPTTSFDKAVTEKVSSLHMVRGNFAWSDIGNVEAFVQVMGHGGAATRVIDFNSSNTLALAGRKTVVFCGVQNLCVIETEDVTLVVDRDQVESVKTLVESMSSDREKASLL